MISKLNFTVIPCLIVILFGCTKKIDPIDPLHVDQGFSFPKGFPPDPGEAGKRDLNGIDSDQDGVRDDLQRWIYARYPNNEDKRKALRVTAKTLQNALRNDLTNEELMSIPKQYDKMTACLIVTFSENIIDPTVESDYVKAKTLNTKERSLSFLKNDEKFDGMVLSESQPKDSAVCKE